MVIFASFQQYPADHPFAADSFDLHPLGAVELVRSWKLGLENVARGPPKITQRHISRKTPVIVASFGTWCQV